jgi:hypothetical protein
MGYATVFYFLPEEEEEFIRYLERVGDVWCVPWEPDLNARKYQASRASDFLRLHPCPDSHSDVGVILLGSERACKRPQIKYAERIEGGTRVVMYEHEDGGSISRIEGGTKRRVPVIDEENTGLIDYRRGGYYAFNGALLDASIYHIRENSKGLRWYRSGEFDSLANRIRAWVRKWTPEKVTPPSRNYATRATRAVARAVAEGLLIG